jgi:hypothetical protein
VRIKKESINEERYCGSEGAGRKEVGGRKVWMGRRNLLRILRRRQMVVWVGR